MIQLGIDSLLRDRDKLNFLKTKRVAILGHPASLTNSGEFSIDALAREIKLSSAFGPQHGLRGDKQDNMIESQDYIDREFGIPIFSLYGEVRKPTSSMLDTFDVLLVDLQDVGTRIYTFITTLRYMLEACAKTKKSVWILDRPNPAGRPVEGMILREGWESFVGAGRLPMRHGLTLGELANWFVKEFKLDVDLSVIKMQDYRPLQGPGFGWPLSELTWVNPSPNAASPSMPRVYPGTVLFEGTNLSEGRGTTRPLEIFGAPEMNMKLVLQKMQSLAPSWLKGCLIRTCYFEPTFHKHQKVMCEGLQIHVDHPKYDHENFKPYRLVSIFLKVVHNTYPDFSIFRDFHYEYEKTRLAFDLINGGPQLREWIEDKSSTPRDLEKILDTDEASWRSEAKAFYLY